MERESAREAAKDSSSSLSAPRSAVVPVVARRRSLARTRAATRRVERTAALTLAARPREVEDVADGVVRRDGRRPAATSPPPQCPVATTPTPRSSCGSRATASSATLAELSRLAHVRGRSQATNDITAESVSARERLREARREREGLLRALARAITLNETDSIKARLRIVNRRDRRRPRRHAAHRQPRAVRQRRRDAGRRPRRRRGRRRRRHLDAGRRAPRRRPRARGRRRHRGDRARARHPARRSSPCSASPPAASPAAAGGSARSTWRSASHGQVCRPSRCGIPAPRCRRARKRRQAC